MTALLAVVVLAVIAWAVWHLRPNPNRALRRRERMRRLLEEFE